MKRTGKRCVSVVVAIAVNAGGLAYAQTLINQAVLRYNYGSAAFVAVSNRTNDTILQNATLKLTKTAHYSSPQLYRGSVIEYTIRIEAIGDSAIRNPVFVDPIPSHTTYVPHSVALDGNAVSDDQALNGNKVRVVLPDMNRGDVHIVRFKVKVNN